MARKSTSEPATGTGATKGAWLARSEVTGKFVGQRSLSAPSYRVLKAGVLPQTVRTLESEGALRRDDVRLIIADRTLDRRIAQGEPLRIEEADGILRLLRVRDHALRVFDTPDLAEDWLRSPNPALDGEVPMTMAATDLGAREVEAVLTRIEHGVFG